MKTTELETTKPLEGRWAILVAVAAVALVILTGCGETTPVGPTAPAPPTEPVDPKPMAAAIANGTYLTAVLGGDVDDALTVEGAKALSADVLTDAEVEALIAAAWWKPVDELITASPKVTAMLAALAPVYGKHVPAATFSPTIREGVTPDPGEEGRFIPQITLGTYPATADVAVRIAGKAGAARTTSCYLTTEEAALLTGTGDDDAAARVAACVSFTGSLSAMQAVDLARTCSSGECAGAAGRGILAAVGATVLHGLAADLADELSNMVTARWFLGSWIDVWWNDGDGDGAGSVENVNILRIRPNGADWIPLETLEEVSLGAWSHRMTRNAGGAFSSGDKVIEYEYVPDGMHTIVIVAQGAWVHRVRPQVAGSWTTGPDAPTARELTIGRDGQATVNTSGLTKSGVVKHEEHYEEREDGRVVLMDDGRPALNGCGTLWFALGAGASPPPIEELTEGQRWRYCFDDEDPETMHAQAPPYGDEWRFDITLTRK